jgi:hypothetical protein
MVYGYIHTPIVTRLGYAVVLTTYEAAWVPEPVWTWWRREGFLLLLTMEPQSVNMLAPVSHGRDGFKKLWH